MSAHQPSLDRAVRIGLRELAPIKIKEAKLILMKDPNVPWNIRKHEDGRFGGASLRWVHVNAYVFRVVKREYLEMWLLTDHARAMG